MTLQVALTVDVEFTIGGAFADPRVHEPVGAESVELRIGDEGAGLDFILSTLEVSGLRGVFFVEAMNTVWFGDEPMGSIARRIAARGHDVQLHAHPCWLAFADAGWRERAVRSPPSDSLVSLSQEEIAHILQIGLEVFSRWGLHRPCAFRAGNLQVDRRIYGMLSKFGIPLASNLGLGAYEPSDRTLHLTGGRHLIDGALEIPVSSYIDMQMGGLRRWKSFTVIGTGSWEARGWLRTAQRTGIDPIVILTHPTEFVHGRGDGYGGLRRNERARQRLKSLCTFLSANRERFEVITFAGQAANWKGLGGTPNPKWRVSALARVARFIENGMMEVIHAG